MRISFIGSGRVATHLAKALSSDHQIIQIYSCQYTHAQSLAELVQAEPVMQLEQMQSDIDLLIIAVSDQAILSVAEMLPTHLASVLAVHTSGSTDIAVLARSHKRAGVFYPLQTFSVERAIDWTSTPLFIEASDKNDLELLNILANGLSNRIYQYSSTQRLSLHLAAVFACNFSNYCYDMAKQVTDAQQVDFSLLHPLILETAQKATMHEPREMQTGPAMRGDQNILKMHQQMLSLQNHQQLEQMYALMSQQILKIHQ